jgi:hypothetical protein
MLTIFLCTLPKILWGMGVAGNFNKNMLYSPFEETTIKLSHISNLTLLSPSRHSLPPFSKEE